MSTTLSEPALKSLGVFGLTTDDLQREADARRERAAAHADTIDRTLLRPGIALITGPSASGKSSVLRALRDLPHTIAVSPPSREDHHQTCIDALLADSSNHDSAFDSADNSDCNLAGALHALSAAGLADAFIPSRPLHALSEGERARFTIARLLLRAQAALLAGHAPTLLLDDFADALDDATAASVVHTLRRWLAHHAAARLVLASVHASLAPVLRPDLHLSLSLGGRASWHISAPAISAPSAPSHDAFYRISTAHASDYAALAPFHYRAGPPATIARVLVARGPLVADPVGVLVVSNPTLNGAWRRVAWPELASRDKRARTTDINRDIRCISRVIVHPLHRARGVGSALIRHYLADPLTPRTEAVSAMGACSPVFVRAGMRQWILPPAPRDLRLIDALSAADLRPWMLADIDLALERVERFPHLDRALRIWAGAHGPTRRLAGADPRALIHAAARHIIAPRHAYTSG